MQILYDVTVFSEIVSKYETLFRWFIYYCERLWSYEKLFYRKMSTSVSTVNEERRTIILLSDTVAIVLFESFRNQICL